MSIQRFILHTKMLIQHGLHLSRSSRMDDAAMRPLDVMRLEERILFSASAMAPVIAQVAEIAASAAPSADVGIVLDHTELFAALQSPQADELSTLTETSATNDAASSDPLSRDSQSILDATNADNTVQNQPGSINPTLELVFIDSSVSNFEQLAADLQNAASADPGRKLELVALDNTKDGIAQITSALLRYRGVDGIHIVSHGGTGQVQIGSTWLSMNNLDTYRNAISAWQYSLSDNADLLFYGCSLEASAEGRQLLTDLSELTQSVAADTVNPAFDTVQTMNAAVAAVNARDVVLVDRQLDDSALLADAVQSGSVVFIYDGTSESAASILDRVAAWSQESQIDIRTLSILSHGVAGGFELGNQWITTSTLDATAADWKQVARHFVQDADIYILGCDVGAVGGGGQRLLNELAFTTSAEVYASDDVTGVGGDWILEMASAGNATLDAAALGQVFDVTELQATNVSLAWYNASWQYRQAVTVSASLLDGSVDETNFTILVDVTQASLKSTGNGGNVAQTDGGDILFTSSDGTTKLSHQIESYDAVTGQIKAWVKVPTLLALSNTSLYAYYGNAAAADQWNDSGAWNSTYGGVWHLSNGSFTDSTSNANNGTNVGSTTTTAIIEEGRSFNGTSQNITVADSNSLDEATLITISAWINPTVNDNSWRSIVGKGPDSAASNYWFGIRQSQLEFWSGGTGYDSNVNISLNTWSHVASTFNASTNTLKIYVNGAEIYSNTSASANPGLNSDSLYIGRSSLNNEWWQGSLDEVRFQDTEESANEIEAQYRTQSSPGTYVTFSSEEGAPFITSNGGGSTTSISVAENSTAVTTVAATDPGTPTQTLTYSISGGVDAARFSINSSSGALTFVSAPNFEAPTDSGANNVYDLIVQVSDGALTDTQAIAVTVTNVNEAPVAVLNTATAVEAGGIANGTAGTNPTGSVLTNDTDVDAGDTKTVSGVAAGVVGSASTNVGSAVTGSFGSINIAANGSYTYTVDNSNATVQALASGQSINDVFTYTMRDTAGLTSATQITVTIQGASDAATLGTEFNGLSAGFYTFVAGGQTFTASVSDYDGSKWLLIGRGREGWEFDTDGQGAASEVVQNLGTVAGFAPKAYSDAIINDMLTRAGTNMSNVELRIMRASTTDGTGTYQDIRWQNFTGNSNAFTWNLEDSPYTVTQQQVNAPSGLAGANTGTSTSQSTYDTISGTFVGNDADRIFTWGWSSHNSIKGFSYGQSVSGTNNNSATSFMWEYTTEDHAIPYTEVYMRLTNPSLAALAYTENDAPKSVMPTIVLNDVDNATLQSATAQITGNYSSAQDILAFTNTANITASWNSTNGTLTLTGNDTVVAYQNALRAVTYQNASDAPSTLTRIVSFSVNEGTNVSSALTRDIAITAVNDAPTATNLSAAETYTENTALNLTDIVVSDIDSASVTVTLTLSNTAAGSLNTGTSGAVTSTYVAGTGVWTASGAIANVNTLLAALTFTPATNFNSNLTIATSVSDGSLSVTGSKAMTGTPVNDAPTATNLSAAQTYTEDTPLALTAIVASDVDSATVTATLTLSSAAAGSLNMGTSGAVTSTWNAGTGVWTASGAIADVNTLLAGLTFTPTLNFNSNFTIATSISDGSLSVTGSKAMTGTPVNDAPTAIADTATAVEAGGMANGTAGTNPSGHVLTNDTDVDAGDMKTVVGILAGTQASASGNVAASVTGTFGSINLAADGAYTYTVNNSNATVQALRASANTITEVFTYTMTDAAGLTSSAQLTITIQGNNDTPHDLATTGLNIPENAANSTSVGTITRSDVDASDTPTYTLVDSAGGRFSIESSTGMVTVANSSLLNYEAATSYNITIRVTDLSGATYDEVFSVTLTDVNEFSVSAPTDTNAAANAVNENVSIGTIVGITAAASDADAMTNAVTYILLDDDGGNFVIDANTGVVTSAAAINRETLGTSRNITVRATSADGSTANTTFTININDVDEFDTGAVTDSNGTTNSVAENAANGTVVGLIAFASDADATTNAINYSLDDSAGGRFTINSSTGVVSVADGTLLNYEAATSHSIIIRATSVDTSYSTQSFTINLIDVNEDAVSTIADSDTTTNFVAENSAIGTVVGITASATDPDGTDVVTYSLTNTAGGRFAIDANTGVVTVAGAIDREAAASYNITIKATSSDTSFTMLMAAISITDVNEFSVATPIDANATANSVTENAVNGTVAGITASAVDSDATTNTVTYSLVDDAGGRFAINLTTGVVTVAEGSLLNFEAATSHNITIRVTSSDLSTATQVMTITLTDVNETPVSVTDTVTAVEAGGISNGTAGTNPLGNVLTNDADVDSGDTKAITGVANGTQGSAAGSVASNVAGAYGTINIAANGAFSYVVNNNNAAVQALRTSSDTLTDTFTYTLTDSGGLTSTTQVTVTIQGANDEQVVATNAGITVAENSTGNVITSSMLRTTDVDDGAASLTYTLTSAASNGTLRLNGVTLTNGTTFTQADINSGLVTYDHDGTENFMDAFSFSVDDGSGTTSTGTFNVTITPVNDNDPTITSNSAGSTALVSIAENTPAVTTVTATDSDLPTQTLTYSITGGADSGLFTMNGVSGVLSFAAGHNFESPTDANSDGVYVVTVQVSDGTRTDNQTISVTITDVNEFSVGSVTDSNAATNTVAENSAIGTTVGITTAATDADGTTNTITYSLVNDDGGRFTIDANTGVVTVAGAIDRETDGATRSITVRATSADTSYTDQLFTIAISDVNETPVTTPIDNIATINSVAENSANGTIVGITAFASDADVTTNSITYSLTDNAGGRFAINSATGVVTVANGLLLNYESATSHSITVRAASADLSTADQTFTINITDVNEGAVSAVVDSDVATNTVAENSAIGTTVGVTGLATDPDGTDVVTYSLTSSAGGRFAIDPNTGAVTVAGAIDREAAALYNITILATSSDTSFTMLTVTISVSDVNESPVSTPTDANATANSVAENASNGTLVGITASAVDSDATTNTATYSLVDDAGGRFAINATTGVVTVADGSLLNFEGATSHTITIRATSSDLSTATQVMTITLTDVNETPVSVTDIGTAVEAGGTSNSVPGMGPSGNVLTNDTDVDSGDTKTVSGVVAGTSASASGSVGTGVAGSYGSINIAADGTYSYTVDNNNLTVQALRASSNTLTDTFTYTMRDAAGLTSSTQITITIEGQNDEQVIATNTGSVIAEGSSGNVITNLMLLASDVDDSASNLTYSLTSDMSIGTLRLNGLALSNGETFTQADINSGLMTYDHDGTENFTDTVSFSVDDGTGSTSTGAFNVTITPVNDSDPTITSDGAGASASISIAENTTVVTTVTATDSDLPAQTLTYSISGADASFFSIGSSSGGLSFAAGRNFEATMDANSDGIYVVTVQVTDGTRTDTQTISVTITDVNEFSVGAVTDSNAAINTVAENSAIGTAVGLTASAADADGTTNTITYSLVNDDGGRFAIDANTGVVTVAGAIDRETDGATRSITVRATSADTSHFDQLFTIAISDVNEAAVTTPIDSNTTANTVVENVSNGTVVGITAFASDADATTNGVTYSLTDDAGGRFTINSTTGFVTVADGSLLDYETSTSHTITVRATSADQSTADDTFTITITDANEGGVSPVVDSNAATNIVTENSAIGTVVGVTASASDPDGTDVVTYSLTDDAGGRFAIDPNTGVVTVAGAINREDAASYDVIIRATSSDMSFASLTLTISIADVNEFSTGTVSDSNAAANSVSENAIVGTTVGITALATDADATTNLVSYTLQNDDGGRFTINSSTGVVAVAGAIDREADGASRSITVRATSVDGSFSDQSFSITIVDANEFPVTTPVDTDATIDAVDENVVIGTIVGITTSANDADSTTNTVTYSLSNSDSGNFTIDSNTGVVTTAALLNRETLGASRNITIRASSADGSHADQIFTIAINDLDEFDVTASIDVNNGSNEVYENASTGILTGIVASSEDSDATTNGINYSLTDNAGGRFAIDSNTGIITVAGVIDRETDGVSLNVTVRATSADGSMADSTFTINVLDVSEYSVTNPIDIDAVANNVDENATIGTIVNNTAQAQDADATTSTISYSLFDNDGGRFTIDSNTGVVTVAGSINRENDGPSRTIIVRASSTDGSTADTSFTIAINDLDEFDVSASADSDPGLNQISEHATVGIGTGLTANAVDGDATNNGVLYGLTNDASGRFAIDANSGVVTLVGAVDRETDGASLSITVRATSTDGSTSDTNFTISVLDEDEFDVTVPVDTNIAANAVDENSAIGTIVNITSSATDGDSTTNTITYILTDDDGGRFAIDASTGLVTVASSLDRETEGPTRSIAIRATSADGSIAEQTLTIDINDVNESAVTAPADIDIAVNQVDENSTIGAVVNITVNSIDNDSTTSSVTYSLTDDDGGRFAIDSTSGLVTVAGAIDRETDGSSRTIIVRATSSDGSTADSTFTIAVNDLDEADVTIPVDTDAVANNVNENSTIGTIVQLTANATDSDATTNSVTYSLVDNDGGRFAVDMNSGVVTVAGAIDRETDGPSRTIIVRAISADGSTADSSFSIDINDLDESDVTAVVDTNNGSNEIDENAAVGTIVSLTAFAEDIDATNNTITYSLTNDDGGRFAIDSVTGIVTVAGAIDREADGASRTITVRATSTDGSTADTTFTIAINDLDEFNTSAVTDANKGSNEVYENAAVGTTVNLTVLAEDIDATTNAITFSLTDNDGGRFVIDSVTGIVTVAGAIDREADGPIRNITVRATSADSSFSEMTFAINVLDADEFDTTAVVDSDAGTDLAAENSAIGTVVGITGFAQDGDATTNSVTYSLTNNDGGRFAIDAVSGVVSVAGLINRETDGATRSIIVRATSADASFTQQTFVISIADINEFSVTAPGDSNVTANNVNENAAIGTAVQLTGFATDSDATTNLVTYSLTDNDGGRFAIDANTGVVTIAGAIDREADGATRSITVRATSADGSTADTTFTIAINDVDEFDTSSVIDSVPSVNSVVENATAGTTVSLTAFADDGDATTNVITYSLTNNDGGRFAINSVTGVVTVAGAINRETDGPIRSIMIRATSADASFTEQTFAIAIVDADEFNVSVPVDANAASNAVSENAANGSIVGVTMSAFDGDATLNGISFTLLNDAGGRFSIDANTGIVTVANGSLLDRELAGSHAIVVQAASDDGSFSTLSVNIALIDVDEFDITPAVDVNATANLVAELALQGTITGITVSASDADATTNAITYSLDDNAGGRFQINASTGVVTVGLTPLNFEFASTYSITARATSADGSAATITLTLGLADVNEFPVTAITDTNIATNTVAENAANGSVVGITAFASDADGTDAVTYGLDNSAGGRFSIDATTGIITVADGSVLNYEAAASHNVTVRASSSDGSSTTQTVTINLIDVNEFSITQIADSTPAANAVNENAANGTLVGFTASAMDADGTNNVITYTLDDNAGGRFAINAATGAVSVANGSLLDRETAASHNIIVRATSADLSFVTQTVSISINDVNEFTTSAVTDTDTNTEVVFENAASGTVVGLTAFAFDADSTNNTVVYSLDANAGGRFAVDANTGILTVADGNLLNYEAQTSHNVTLRATSADGSFQARTFAIQLTDVDEFDVAAITDTNLAADAVNENAAVGTLVGITASAFDADGSNNTITWTLDDNAGGRFAIDSTTGIVTVADGSLLDRELATSHSIIARATSSDSSFTTRSFAITVSDLNDTAPIITQSQQYSVSELAGVGTIVGSVLATDADSVGTIQNWSIVGGNSDGIFSINAATGRLSVSNVANLNFERSSSYTLLLATTDGVNASQTETVTISVVDENEAPVLEPSSGFMIDENFSNNTLIGQVTAADVDAADQLTYSLSSSVLVPAFSIDAATGEISVRDSSLLNFEALRMITLTVQVTDRAGLRDSLTTVVNLRDVNEVPTSINLTGGMVTENSAAGVLVGTVSGTDPDAGDQLTYSLLNNVAGSFVVNSSTGAIIVAPGADLNYEAATSHTIVVRATDRTGLFFDQTFTINVRDINEAPIALADVYYTFQLTKLNVTPLFGVVWNDYDDDGDTLTAQLISGVGHGTLLLRADGSLLYDPVDVFTGTVTFTYRVTDGVAFSNSVTVTIDVLPTVNPGGGGSGNGGGDGSGTGGNTGGDGGTGNGTDPGIVIVPPGLGGGTNNTQTTTETTSFDKAVAENSDDSIDADADTANETPVFSLGTSPTIPTIVESGFSGRTEIDYRPDAGPQNVMQGPASAVWGNSTIEALPFDALVRSIQLHVEPQNVSHAEVDHRFAGFTTGDLVVGTSAVVSTSVSVGIMVWVLRGGSLLTAFMSATPVWTAFDPLPILVNRGSAGPKEDDTLLSLVKGLRK